MNFETTGNKLSEISADGVLVFAFEKDKQLLSSKGLSEINKDLNGLLLEAIKLDDFKAKNATIFSFNTQRKILAPKIFVLGLGKKEEFNQNKLRLALASFTKSFKSRLSSVALSLLDASDFDIDAAVSSQIMVEGIILGAYRFGKYKKKEESEKPLETVTFSESNKNTVLKIKEGVKEAQVSAQAVILARDLVNEPSNYVTPTVLAQIALDIAKKNPQIKCTVYDRPEIEKMGMGAFLGVAQGSDTPPKFIHLEYSPKSSTSKKQKIALVGKGITFDSGGLSIKPESSMRTMKLDMAGAAAVLGVFSVISEIKPSVPVMGIIAATPNLISGKAFAPGDILKAANGKTIEVLSTDAEGRLTLVDSITYALKKKATEIIDLATLTGACEVALGTDIAGLFGNNNDLKEKIKKSSKETGERVWELPLVSEYKELNKSEIADISNIPSTRYGGAITGALFLEEFVDNKPWVHLDIAGPAFAEKNYDLGPKGGTGYGVRLLLNFLKNL